MARRWPRLRLSRWQPMRWGLVLPSLVLGAWACSAHELQVPTPNPQQQTDFQIIVGYQRAVDILFMIDNSPSMDPKQAALAENFPKMIAALEKLEDGLPDVRIGVVSSDMGAGWGEARGNCDVPLGNQGILWGNDPDVDPAEHRNKYATVKHLRNDAQTEGCGMNVGARWIEDAAIPDSAARSRNYRGKLTDVFSCLAKAVGVSGCGYEHPLQSVRLALNPTPDINKAQNLGFLRRDAYLAVVLIADEDDCSAEPDSRNNDEMFFPDLWKRETGGLRCAARGHVCNGQDIPHYEASQGYTASGPFEANFLDCDAKDVERQPPQGPDGRDPSYQRLPLIRIRDLVDSVKQVKAQPDYQILVSGIIGWPQKEELANAKYRIDKDPTSGDQHELWDYMPICTVPGQTSADGNTYKAYGGFRLKKFIDAFNVRDDKSVFSICSTSNFADAMETIGNTLAVRLRPGCVTYPLIDINPELDEIQPECQVMYRMPCQTPGQGECLLSGYRQQGIPECVDPGTGDPLDPRDPVTHEVPDDARPCWYLVYDGDKNSGCPDAFKNQRISVLRKGDGLAPRETMLGLQCRTCPSMPTWTGESSCPPGE